MTSDLVTKWLRTNRQRTSNPQAQTCIIIIFNTTNNFKLFTFSVWSTYMVKWDCTGCLVTENLSPNNCSGAQTDCNHSQTDG